MKIETQEAIASIYNRVSKMQQSAIAAKNKCLPKSIQAVMLAGKVKAYTDTLSLIKSKYRGKVVL